MFLKNASKLDQHNVKKNRQLKPPALYINSCLISVEPR
nr:MAG TPA: hypothetical protein [Caudoviricetes sp.]DAW01548.1 MAG TPA: hypothetical protein [Caudoviricetes sp.]